MEWIIDRIEEDLAVCETEEQMFVNIPLSLLPKGAKEGSVLRFIEGDYVLDTEEESNRRGYLSKLQSLIFEADES